MTKLEKVTSLLWLAIITGHAFAAAAWWWIMPAGFPIHHPRFWVNQVLPVVVVAAMLVARFVRGRWADTVRPAILVMLPCTWLAAGVAATLVFPKTFGFLVIVPAIAGALLSGLCILSFGSLMRRSRAWLITAALGCILGSVLPASQKTWHVGTTPTGSMTAVAPARPTDAITLRPKPDMLVYSRSGAVTVTHGRLMLGLQPLLTFDSRSPDGCLTLLTTANLRRGPARVPVGIEQFGDVTRFVFADDDVTTISIDSSGDSNELKLEAVSRLPEVVWSHLNTFNELTVTGHRKLSLRFSPCPDESIDVLPMDYPRGRPARFAYLDASHQLRIVQASGAEKGPFTELASGPLNRDDSLTMTLLDDGIPRMEITFHDFASQADTQLSPTAGWGVPVNAIEFRLGGDSPTSPAEIFMTLASTSVGRGYESVGHAPGVYRNRVTIRRLP